MFDLVIRNARVVDGSGAASYLADVALSKGKVAKIFHLLEKGDPQAPAGTSDYPCHHQIDVQGLVLAPGFIDVHTHDDRLVLEGQGQGLHPKLSQGVTTVVTGNCGISLAPLVTQDAIPPLNILGQEAFRFATFASYLDALEEARPALNVACLVGHTTLRVAHMAALDRPAQADEVRAMRKSYEEALAAGVLGLSTGLFYPPAQAANAEEVIALAAPMQSSQRVLTMHIRDEGDAIDRALDEAFEIAKQLDVGLVLSHHKLAGIRNHGRSVQTLARIDAANSLSATAREQPASAKITCENEWQPISCGTAQFWIF